jgi:hypothetical protein
MLSHSPVRLYLVQWYAFFAPCEYRDIETPEFLKDVVSILGGWNQPRHPRRLTSPFEGLLVEVPGDAEERAAQESQIATSTPVGSAGSGAHGGGEGW